MLCITCQQPIPQERLDAVPSTRTCLSCSKVTKAMGLNDYAHKTSPSLVILNSNNREARRRADRYNRRCR